MLVSEHDSNDDIATSYDHILPPAVEPAAQYYLRVIRIYLGLCTGTVSLDDAISHVESLKEHPEFTKRPTDPTILPLSDTVKARLLDNLQTLSKYNLCNADAIQSAYNFAFLQDNNPLNTIDSSILQYLVKQPLAPVSAIATAVGVTPRTVLLSLRRLRERNGVRFTSIVDTGVFGLESVILFFRLQDGVDPAVIESGLARFPLTKSLLINRETRHGYVGLLFPASPYAHNILRTSVRRLVGPVFKRCTLHDQVATGAYASVRLLENGVWRFPDEVSDINAVFAPYSDEVPLLYPARHDPSFTRLDYAIAAQFRLSIRESAPSIAQNLSAKGFSVTPSRVYQTIRRLKRRHLILPHVLLGGLNLSTNFCFEILCDSAKRQQILSLIPFVPSAMYYLSSRGIILWIHVPSTYQVEYFQLFKSLETLDGVQSVNALVTLTPPGSRSMLDLEKNWKYSPQGWYVDPEQLNLFKWLS